MQRPAAIFLALTLMGGRTAQAQSSTSDAGSALTALLRELQNDQLPITQVIANLVTTEISTFPAASSSAGFTYTFDPQLGVPALTTKSFGPLFVERPETAGRGRLAVSFDVQHMQWHSIDRLGLNNGDLFRSDPSVAQSFIDLRSTTAAIGVTVGVTDRIDVGANVPLVVTAVSGHSTFFALRADIAGTSQGIGDVTLRSKVRLLGAGHSGASASVELRLPTGDSAKLLGVGKSEVRVLFIAQEHGDVVSHHVNVGYTFAGSGAPRDLGLSNAAQQVLEPSDEVNYSGGIDVAAARRLTVSGDLIGRALRNTVQVTMSASGDLTPVPRNFLPLLVVVAGAKVNIAGQWLLRASVLFPITDNGLKPTVTPLIGLERAF
jgi:hypothetical protein